MTEHERLVAYVGRHPRPTRTAVALVDEPHAAPDPALVVRWMVHLLDLPEIVQPLSRSCLPGEFGATIHEVATAMARTGMAPR